MSLRPVLKRASRTDAMTASVPLMWNDTSSSPEICRRRAMFSAVTGCSGPSTGPSSRTRSRPRAIHSLYRPKPATFTP